jgi:hypothetical protein
MQDSSASIAAMAEKCRTLIEGHIVSRKDLPRAISPNHLLRMCDRIEKHTADWPDTKLHRWIGFVQCGMIANGILDLPGAKSMFDSVKNEYLKTSEDQDLTDHLDPESTFDIDVGGQG